ncbi:MAG: 3'(2'),5'-bisphosphate nucleotidase CysQ [Actinomycetes bacterium]
MSDHELAATIARRAGELLLAIRDGFTGDDGDHALGDRGDRDANELILQALAEARPDDAVLSEESADDPSRLTASRVWIVDPLDGTREYRERRTDWAVHVALAVAGVPVVGAVALPALGLVLATDPAPTVAPATGGPPRIIVSRTRDVPITEPLRAALGAEVVPMGSAGAKAMAIVRGEADLYAHEGGQYQWDNCAPVAVALAAGLHASRLDGSPIVYNGTDTSLPDLLICRPELADAALEVVHARDAS